MTAIYSTEPREYGYYGMKSYRIEKMRTEHGQLMQRHVWTRDDGTIQTEKWICSIESKNEEDWYKPTGETA